LIFASKLHSLGRNYSAFLQDRVALAFSFLRYHPALTFIFTVIASFALLASILWQVRPTFIQTSLDAIATRVPGFVAAAGSVVADIAAKNPGPTAAFIGLFVPFVIFLLARPDRKLQRRRVYMDLEFESARIFRTCVDHPEIVNYLEGASGDANPEVSEKVYWHVCQVLNTFELMIALYKEGMVQIDVFSTWVSWFHELGTAQRFGDFWDKRGLSFHYKIELQEIMDQAQALLRNRTETTSNDAELGIFHRGVSDLLKDYRILQHFEKSQKNKARRIEHSWPKEGEVPPNT
jgi:hypothetical protein